MNIDVTSKIEFKLGSSEILFIEKCVCGRRFSIWEFLVNLYPESARCCPYCGRKLFFKFEIKIFEIKE